MTLGSLLIPSLAVGQWPAIWYYRCMRWQERNKLRDFSINLTETAPSSGLIKEQSKNNQHKNDLRNLTCRTAERKENEKEKDEKKF